MASAMDSSAGPYTPGPTVGELCSTNFLAVPRRRRVVEVARLMAERWLSSAFVTAGGEPIGVLTKRTIIKDVLARGYTGMEITAGEIMHSPIITIGADEDVDQAAAIMARTGLRHLAVERDGRVVGLISHYHIARALPDLLRRREAKRNVPN